MSTAPSERLRTAIAGWDGAYTQHGDTLQTFENLINDAEKARNLTITGGALQLLLLPLLEELQAGRKVDNAVLQKSLQEVFDSLQESPDTRDTGNQRSSVSIIRAWYLRWCKVPPFCGKGAGMADQERANRADAIKTYLEQTKLLVTLASAFLIAPAALLALDPTKVARLKSYVKIMAGIEAAFIVSVITGYIVLGTVVGSQDDGTYNVYRGATRGWSVLQFFAYLVGLGGLMWLVVVITAA
jgi:hypothetical protein